MKAAQVMQFGDSSHVVVTDIGEPVPNAGQLVADVRAAGFNPFDSIVRKGMMPKAVSVPYTPGGDFSGVSRDGTEIFGTAIILNGGSGAFAQRAAVNASTSAPKPKKANFPEAAALPLIGTSSVQALEETIRLKPRQKILIHGGAGGIGHIAIQLAKSMGAWVATTVRTKDMEFARSLGADTVIDFTVSDFSQKLEGLDAVYDTVGGVVTEKSFPVLKRGGMLVSMKGEPDPSLCTQYGVKGIGQNTKQTTMRLMRVAELVDDGKIHVHIDKIFPLEAVSEAWAYQENGKPQGKVVLYI